VTSGWSKFALWWKKVENNQPIGFHQSIFKHQLKADDHGDDELLKFCCTLSSACHKQQRDYIVICNLWICYHKNYNKLHMGSIRHIQII